MHPTRSVGDPVEREGDGHRRTGPHAVLDDSRPAPVSTRLAPPPGPERIVVRPRVTKCFSGALDARLTLVTGAPGIGKTAAVREWIEDIDARVAWLTAGTEDNDLRDFQRDVAGSVQRVAPEVPARFDAVSEIDSPLVLVIDDCQAITSTDVVGALRFLLEHKTPSLHVVVASRSDPPLPLARWRARGELHEVREAQLRFRPDEARAYLAMFDDLAIDDDAIATLVQRTEGWIAGLQLAVISLRTSDDPATFIDRFGGTDRFIADFLLDDVLEHQPDDIRDLLLDMSVLDEFDTRLCAALTGRHDVEHQLRRVEAANLFLVRVDDAGTTMRYHALFRDLLRSELDSRSPQRARDLRRRAAALVAHRGDRVAAIALLVDAGDDDAAFELAMPHDVELDLDARAETRAGLNLLRESFVAADRDRVVRFADALLKAGRIEEAAGWLTRVGAASRSGDDEPAVSARLDAVWSRLYAASGEADLVIRRAGRALMTVSRDRLPHETMLRGLEVDLARAWLLERNTRQAERRLRLLDDRALDPLMSEVAVPSLRARIAAAEGRLRDADTTARRALRFATTLGATRHPAALDALLAVGQVRYERNDIADAKRAVEATTDLASELSAQPYLALARLAEIRLVGAEHGAAAALHHLTAVSGSFSSVLPRCITDAIALIEAHLSLVAGDAERAARLVATVPASFERVLLAAEIDIANGESKAARRRLDALEPLTLVQSVRVELLHAAATDDAVEQRRHVATAATLAAPDLLRRRFVQSHPSVVRAARALATSADADPLTRQFLESVTGLPVVTPAGALVDSLTERERSVLRYLSTTLDYRDIASELFISANTLKTHVASIHRKLGASSRAQAVRQAEQLGLLHHH